MYCRCLSISLSRAETSEVTLASRRACLSMITYHTADRWDCEERRIRHVHWQMYVSTTMQKPQINGFFLYNWSSYCPAFRENKIKQHTVKLQPQYTRIYWEITSVWLCGSSLRNTRTQTDLYRHLYMPRQLSVCLFSVFAHLHGADIQLRLTLRPWLGQALHSLKDPVNSALRGFLLQLQVIQLLLQISDLPPQPVPPGSQYLHILPHLKDPTLYLIIYFNNIF